MNPNRKRIISIILVVVLLILSGVAIFIAVRLTQDQAPDDSSAGTCDPATYGRKCQYTSHPINGGSYRTGYVCKCVAVTGGGSVVNCAEYNTSECPTETQTDKCPQGVDFSGACGEGCPDGQRMEYRCNTATGDNTSKGCKYDTSCPSGTTGDGSKTSLTSCTATCSDSDGCTCPTNPVCSVGSGASISNGATCGGATTSCNYCAIYTCSFDSNGDDQCTLADEGASVSFSSGSGCSVDLNRCIQVDFYPTEADARAGTNYCRHEGNPGGNCQDTSIPPSSETVTCYKCTDRIDDSNTCESITINGSSCPSGYTTNSVCSQAVGGACPVQTVTTTCYKCTDTLSDNDQCESFTVNGSVCPAGSTTQSACEEAVGGACPITTSENLTCYRCTTSLSDGNTCESFVTTNDSCPAGSSATLGACKDALGGVCPGELPETALFDNDRDNRLALGFITIILGIIFYRFELTQKSLKLFGEYVSMDREAKSLEKKRSKRDRSLKNFENKVEGQVSKKK